MTSAMYITLADLLNFVGTAFRCEPRGRAWFGDPSRARSGSTPNSDPGNA
jgi:hypothetical protein